MKKIISLILCIVLFLCVCGCGNTQTASPSDNPSSSNPSSSGTSSSDPSSTDSSSTPTGTTVSGGFKINYLNIVNGNILHKNETEYNIETSNAFESTDNFYIYLPAGTEIYCSDSFAVYCYDDNFALDKKLTQDCGQTLIQYTPKMSADKRTLKTGSYVRFSVKGKVSNIVIKVPKGKDNEVIYGEKEDLKFKPIIQQMKSNLSGKETNVNYIFLTDIHYVGDPSSDHGRALFTQVKAAVKLANNIDSIDFIAIGGDITNGNRATKAECLQFAYKILEPLKECKKPVFVAPGNHDDNSYHMNYYSKLTMKEIVSDKDWSDKILKEICPKGIVKDSKYKDSKYYYYDIKGKKTRVIVLDAIDYRAKYDSNGTVIELPVKNAATTNELERYWTGTSYWGYSDEQIQWLANEALTAGSDWDYVFISHMGVDKKTMHNNYDTKSGASLRAVISAFQNRNTYSATNISANFTNVTGKILVHQFGHSHCELTTYQKDIKLWQIGTATAQIQSSNSSISNISRRVDQYGNEWLIYPRAYGKENEHAFDIMSANENSINKFVFGAGTEKVLKYE